MNCSEMLDKATKIIARTDVDRALLLLFMNSARRAVLREKTIRKFFDYRAMAHVNGVIDAGGIKLARKIEYVGDTLIALKKFKSLDDARSAGYTDFTATGTPACYLEMGTSIQILPVPTSGVIKIYGEFWPADLTDSAASNDVTTYELPEAFIYLAAAEYFDYFDEADKGQYWRQKGAAIVASYVKEDAKQRTFGVGMYSDPFGNGGVY